MKTDEQLRQERSRLKAAINALRRERDSVNDRIAVYANAANRITACLTRRKQSKWVYQPIIERSTEPSSNGHRMWLRLACGHVICKEASKGIKIPHRARCPECTDEKNKTKNEGNGKKATAIVSHSAAAETVSENEAGSRC